VPVSSILNKVAADALKQSAAIFFPDQQLIDIADDAQQEILALQLFPRVFGFQSRPPFLGLLFGAVIIGEGGQPFNFKR
jgi:hypothetical protein